MKKIFVFIKKWIKIAICFCVAGGILLVGTNLYMLNSVKSYWLTEKEAAEMDVDCILVLGAGVLKEGVPSLILADRLTKGIEIYENKSSGKMLMTGDHGRADYDEVNTMKQFAIEKGVLSEDIFMDHAGFSTYESMYRAANVFGCKKIVIVTQEYHLYRALYIARSLGIEAYGVPARNVAYLGQNRRDVRELLARTKDFFKVLIKPESTYVGEAIPVNGNGDITNDR